MLCASTLPPLGFQIDLDQAALRLLWPTSKDPCRTPLRLHLCIQSNQLEAKQGVLTEYERVRAHSRRFALAPGHEDTRVEERIESHLPRYMVVEKRGQAGRVTEGTDPRSS